MIYNQFFRIRNSFTAFLSGLVLLTQLSVSAQLSENIPDQTRLLEFNLVSLPEAFSVTGEDLQKYAIEIPWNDKSIPEIQRIMHEMAPSQEENLLPEVLKQIEFFRQYPRETGLMVRIFRHYESYLTEETKSFGLPDWYKYLPAGLSCFNPKGNMLLDGAGIWQLRKSSALSTGLKVNQIIDERYDFARVTESALTSLKILVDKSSSVIEPIDNFIIFPLSQKNIKTISNHASELQAKSELDKMTKGIIAASLAFRYIIGNAKYSSEYALDLPDISDLLLIPYYKLQKIAENKTMSDILMKYNFHILKIQKSDDETVIRCYIPQNHLTLFNEFLDQIDKTHLAALKKESEKQSTETPSSDYIKYKVKKGDVLGTIARKHGVSVNEIKKMNHLRSDLIREGQILKIPL